MRKEQLADSQLPRWSLAILFLLGASAGVASFSLRNTTTYWSGVLIEIGAGLLVLGLTPWILRILRLFLISEARPPLEADGPTTPLWGMLDSGETRNFPDKPALGGRWAEDIYLLKKRRCSGKEVIYKIEGDTAIPVKPASRGSLRDDRPAVYLAGIESKTPLALRCEWLESDWDDKYERGFWDYHPTDRSNFDGSYSLFGRSEPWWPTRLTIQFLVETKDRYVLFSHRLPTLTWEPASWSASLEDGIHPDEEHVHESVVVALNDEYNLGVSSEDIETSVWAIGRAFGFSYTEEDRLLTSAGPAIFGSAVLTQMSWNDVRAALEEKDMPEWDVVLACRGRRNLGKLLSGASLDITGHGISRKAWETFPEEPPPFKLTSSRWHSTSRPRINHWLEVRRGPLRYQHARLTWWAERRRRERGLRSP